MGLQQDDSRTSILLSNFLASFIRPGDELLFPLDLEAGGANTGIYIRHNPEERREDVFQTGIGYVSHARKDKRDNLFVSGEVSGSPLGISAINVRCETLRDYFYVGNRRRAWDRQPSLLRVPGDLQERDKRRDSTQSAQCCGTTRLPGAISCTAIIRGLGSES